MTARERLGALFQPGAFQKSGMHIHHSGRHFGGDGMDIPADAIVTGTGYVDGQLAAAAQDFTVSGGAVGKMHATKIIETMKMKTSIIARQAGNVADILVNVGDGVQTGQVLVKLT
jgi:acetyl-CoA carboxylase carboxyltransferase component